MRVAAGVLQRADGRILLAQRPVGKIAAGRWEFPGGKIEAGESPHQALTRELAEEIGIELRQARPLICLRHAYSERVVELDTWLLESWQGEPRGLESQALAWVDPQDTAGYDILEADGPILDALCLPAALPVTGEFASQEELCRRAAAVFAQGHRLLRFRAPALDDGQYLRMLEPLAATAETAGAAVLVDRLSAAVTRCGVAGLHLRAADLQRVDKRPLQRPDWLLASVHDARDIARAREIGVDALVLGHVAATATHPAQAPLGWSGFAALVQQADVPVYAIGGLSGDDLERAWQAGAQGIAAISAYW